MILLAIFLLGLVVYPSLVSQATEAQATPVWTPSSVSDPDFRIEATIPNTVLADGTTHEISTIIVNSIAGFSGTVTLSNLPLPMDLSCIPISPTDVPNGSGLATLSCSSIAARTYPVTIVGTSAGIRHNANTTFTFVSSTSADFTIAATSPVTFSLGSTTTVNITVTPVGGFDSQVNFATAVYPIAGLSVSLMPQSLLGSGTSTATFNSTKPGDYTVTFNGTSQSLLHTITIIVDVTLVDRPDFRIAASSSFISVYAGNVGTTRIIITPSSSFAGSITLVALSPLRISCSLSPTSIQSSGESTLTCSSHTAGDYSVSIMATGAGSSHITTVDVHVVAVSPAGPDPPSTVRPYSVVIYVVVGVIVIVATAGTVLALRRSRHSAL